MSRSAPGLPAALVLALHPLVPPALARASWSRPKAMRADLRAHGLGQMRALGPRASISPASVPDRRRPIRYCGPAAPDPALCRPRRGREEHRGVPRAAASRAPRWWSATGPRWRALRGAFPDAHFLGPPDRRGARRVPIAGADVFVFPSRTDTFGLVMIEALACGTPVAAYPVTGPLDMLDADKRRDGRGPRHGDRRALTLRPRRPAPPMGAASPGKRSARNSSTHWPVRRPQARAEIAAQGRLSRARACRGRRPCTKSAWHTGRPERGGPSIFRPERVERPCPRPSR